MSEKFKFNGRMAASKSKKRNYAELECEDWRSRDMDDGTWKRKPRRIIKKSRRFVKITNNT